MVTTTDLTRDLRASFELFGRTWPSAHSYPTYLTGLGVEIAGPINTATGTWGATDIQLRVTLSASGEPELEAHNVYLDQRFLFGRLNLRLGHFQLPFGLEALPLDTHTTIIQLANPRSLGIKHDWGVSLRGQVGPIDYDVSYSLGSGMDFEPTVAGLGTARVGWSAAGDWLGLGLAVLGGERLHGPSRTPTTGWRVGADLTYRLAFLRLLAEVAAGQDEASRVLSLLLRLETETADGLLLAAAQYGVLERPGLAGATHRAELELALRLVFIARDSFIRVNLAYDDLVSGHFKVRPTVLLYLRFG